MCGFVKIFQRQSLEFFKNFPAERRNRFLPYLQHQIAVKPCCKRGCQINQQQLQTNPPKSCKIEYGNIFINRNTNQAGCVNRTKGCKCNTDNGNQNQRPESYEVAAETKDGLSCVFRFPVRKHSSRSAGTAGAFSCIFIRHLPSLPSSSERQGFPDIPC